MLGLLDNQTALITGATGGIGKAIALNFAKNGAKVAFFGRNRERGEQVISDLRSQSGKEGMFIQVDVSKQEEVIGAVEKVMGHFGSIDILVNNAGITKDQLFIKMSEKDWDDVIAINLKSCYNTARVVARSMIKERKGKMINMSSVVGIKGNPSQANYAASKAGIIGFTKALARELAGPRRNICVNCIAPGFIDTSMTQKLSETQKQAALSQIPFRRMGSPEDVANTALFLASHLSDYITGQVIVVDGGLAI